MDLRQWTADDVWLVSAGYQQSCVLAAAVDLELFDALADDPATAEDLAGTLGTDVRATIALADALVAMGALVKEGDVYSVPPSAVDVLTSNGPNSMLAIAQHHANCLRRWVQLARVVKTGQPAERVASVRGPEADQAAFIEGMNDISRRLAPQLIDGIPNLRFRHLLDVGGGSGTWTIEFLRAVPDATATLFDLPHVVPMAERRLAEAGLADRVTLVAGDFYEDDLPGGADLVWLGAIVHQNSRQQNRDLFAKCLTASEEGRQILVRDVVMDETHTQPLGGAMFAINMLVATPGGGTFSFEELREDLEASGFADVRLVRQGEFMDSLVRAVKPSA